MKLALPEISVTRSIYYAIISLIFVIWLRAIFNTEHDYDLWWQLFFGKEILLRKTIPVVDIYSFTATGSAIYDHEWLTQVIFYLTDKYSGGLGMIFLRAFLYSGMLASLFMLLRRRVQNKFYLCVVLFLLVSVIKPGISFRVQMFTYFFAGIVLYLEETRANYWQRFLLYPLVFVAWANMHGAFVLGLVMVSVYSLDSFVVKQERGLRLPGGYRLHFCPKACLLILICALATLFNPYEFDLWRYVFNEVTTSRSSEYITEWKRFSFEPREMAFLVLLIISWLATLFSLKRQKVTSVLLLVLGSYLGLSAVRHTPLLSIMALPVLLNAFSAMSQKPATENLLSRLAALVFLCASTGIFFFSLPISYELRDVRDPLPKDAVIFTENNQLKGNMFVPLHWGGYVLNRLYPDVRVSIDGRWATTYPEHIMDLNMNFFNVFSAEQILETTEKFNSNLILFEKGHPEIPRLVTSSSWQIAFEGVDSVLVVRP